MQKQFAFLLLSALALIIVLGSCSLSAKVYSEEEPGINLYKYHTYNWLENTTVEKGNSGPEWLTNSTQNNIRAEVETQMSRYGYKICTENPDLVLHYHVVIKNEVLYVQDWECAVQALPGEDRFARCNRVKPVHYREGSLILDFIDRQNSNQVWRGVVTDMLDNMTPDQVDARVKEAVRAIFKKFPEKPLPLATP